MSGNLHSLTNRILVKNLFIKRNTYSCTVFMEMDGINGIW